MPGVYFGAGPGAGERHSSPEELYSSPELIEHNEMFLKMIKRNIRQNRVQNTCIGLGIFLALNPITLMVGSSLFFTNKETIVHKPQIEHRQSVPAHEVENKQVQYPRLHPG